MIWWMPVLRENDVLEEWRNAMDRGNDLVAMRNGQRSTRAEVILHINNDENVVGAYVQVCSQIVSLQF